MRVALATLVAFIAISACGGSRADHHTVTVERYVYANGTVPGPSQLGLTFGPKRDGYHSLINALLLTDDDADKIVRVIVHELANVLTLEDRARPPAVYGWYVYDSDTLPPFTPMRPDEAAWIAGHGQYRVRVAETWLEAPVRFAIARIDAAGAAGVFLVSPEG